MEVHKMTVLKGICACPGEAEGKIVRYSDFRTFTQEDIVVLDEYVTQNILRLKHAGGIISSLGGITCHASIIAREFNIPCLIGVKGADLLKQGTMVRLDAAAEEVELQ
jgi:pyruvate,water dikinase